MDVVGGCVANFFAFPNRVVLKIYGGRVRA